MNNAELFARGDLINQTIKINSLHAEVKRNGKYAFFLSLFDLTSKMQSPTVAPFSSSFVNMQHKAKSVIHKCCDLHMNMYNSPLCDQKLIKAAPVKHC